MTATSNPQAAAEQARKNYRDVTTPGATPLFRRQCEPLLRSPWLRPAKSMIAPRMRSTHRCVLFEKTFDAAGQGPLCFNRKIIDLGQRNVNSVFDLAKSLARARNLSDIVQVQAAYWQKQVSALTAQAEEVRALSTKVAADTAEPIKEQVKRGVDELRKAN